VSCRSFRTAPPRQRPQHRGILGLDDRVGPLGTATDDLEAALVYHRAETILPKPELVDRLEPARGLRVEHRPEGEDEGIDPQRGVAQPPRGARSPASQRDDHSLQFLAPLGQLVDPGGSRRRELASPYHPRPHQLPQALGEDVGADLRQAGPQIREALGTEQKLAHHQQRPALPDDVEGVGRSTGVVVGARGGHSRDSIRDGPDLHPFRCSREFIS
jgi:hypothetical protein